MRRLSLLVLAGALSLLALLPAAGQAPPGQALAVEAVGDRHYFHVRFDRPAGLFRAGLATPGWWEDVAPDLTPRLVPEGDAARLVCHLPSDAGLEFVGRYDPKADAVKARLLYPVAGDRPGSAVWKTVLVGLDFKAARRGDGLATKWAAAQVGQFEDLSARAGEFGFYSFAATATARKHGLPAPKPLPGQAARFDFSPARLYELTTGATAITESLQLRRMTVGPAKAEERTVPVASLAGIDIREHPWEKMMAGQKPADEPLARLIPHDNYFVTFRDPAKLVEFADLLTLWGGNLTRSFEFTSRDYRLWERYERQLALDSAALAKGGLGIRGVAVTGNDAYLRDGTDVTVLFRTDDPKALLAVLDAGVAAARKRHGAKLVSAREANRFGEADGVESHVAPLREVSVYRAVVGDVVVVSNSAVAQRRVRDAAQGKAKCLADSLDFKYMRVVFRADDPAEDGFLYLPDAFIRTFVGPASRIKQKRRLEALAGLHLMTHGALLAAWETGKLPASAAELYRLTGLKPDEVAVSDGPIGWDAARGAAVSEVYGSIHFATPLVELDIDRVTATEAREYGDFRLGYLRLWQRFFDPVGMRLGLRGGLVKLETYILPLIESEFYGNLRESAGNGTTTLDPASISPRALLQYTTHLNPDRARGSGLGDRVHFRLDDGPEVARLLDPKEWDLTVEREPLQRLARLLADVPLAATVAVTDPKRAATTIKGLQPLVRLFLVPGWEVKVEKREYRGVAIDRWALIDGEGKPAATLSYAFFGGGLHATFSAAMMDRLIDEDQAKPAKGDPVAINASLHVAPPAAVFTRRALDRLIEAPTRHEARAGLALWYALYGGGLIRADADPAEAAFRVLGFVPVAPDRTGYRYDRAADEVVNDRHGSFRQPGHQPGLAESSPVYRLLENVRAGRVDLRFREDGIHTTLTLARDYSPDRLEAMSPAARATLVEELTQLLSGPERSDRGRAAHLLGKLGPAAKAAVPALQAALFDYSPEIRAIAEAALAKIDPAAATPTALGPQTKERLTKALTAGLRSSHAPERTWAEEALRRLGPDYAGALRDGLIATVNAPDRPARVWAMDSLGRLGPEARESVPALRVALFDRSAEIRAAADAALAKIDPTPLTPAVFDPPRRTALFRALAEGLKAGDADERAWAVDGFLRLGAEAGPAFRDGLIAALAAPDRAARVQAVERLGTLGPDAKAAVPALQAALFDFSPAVRAAAEGALPRIDPASVRLAGFDPQRKIALTRTLTEGLKSRDAEERAWSVEGLGRFGPDGAGPLRDGLTAALGSPDSAVRQHAAVNLGLLGAQAKGSVPALQAALYDFSAKVQVAAEEALKRIDPPSATPASVPAATKARLVAAWTASLRSEAVEERRGSAEQLARLEVESRSAVPALLDAVGDADGTVQAAAVVALKEIGTERPKADALPRLVRAAGSKQGPVRAWAIEQLVRVGPEAKAVVPVLLDALDDGDPAVRVDAIRAARAVDADRGTALARERLVLALRSPARATRDWAVATLKTAGPDFPEGTTALLAELRESLRTGDGPTRVWVADTLSSLGPSAKAAVPALLKALDNDGSYDVRVAAKNAIIAIDPATARKEGLLK